MDKGAVGVSGGDKGGARSSDPDEEADQLRRDIRTTRDKVGTLVSELDHRRHEALDVKLQLRRHAVPLLLGGVAVIGLVAGGIALSVHRARSRKRVATRIARLRQAVARMIAHPERVARGEPHAPMKIATAGGTAAASMLARQLVQRLISRR